MNASNFIHAAVAVAIQLGFYFAFHDALAGGAAGLFYFLGRECAQNEYRWMEDNGKVRADLPWQVGFTYWNKTDALLDWVIPAIAVTAVYFAIPHLGI